MARRMIPEGASGNIFLRHNWLDDVGDCVPGHAHEFDHTSFVLNGRVHVDCVLRDGTKKSGDFGPGEHFLVHAGVEHLITATEPGVHFVCIYSHNTPQGSISQVWTGWEKAYN